MSASMWHALQDPEIIHKCNIGSENEKMHYMWKSDTTTQTQTHKHGQTHINRFCRWTRASIISPRARNTSLPVFLLPLAEVNLGWLVWPWQYDTTQEEEDEKSDRIRRPPDPLKGIEAWQKLVSVECRLWQRFLFFLFVSARAWFQQHEHLHALRAKVIWEHINITQ